jgi:hypothetical protein
VTSAISPAAGTNSTAETSEESPDDDFRRWIQTDLFDTVDFESLRPFHSFRYGLRSSPEWVIDPPPGKTLSSGSAI